MIAPAKDSVFRSGEPTIVLDQVTKSFGKNLVLNGVTGTISSGKVVGLLGRNGEGKTTLFKLMMDLIRPDFGSTSILGIKADGSARIRGFIGYVPERPIFHPFMTAEEVLRFRSSFFSKWNWIKARGIAARLELDLTTSLQSASKGTIAKLAWICATAHNPEVLLLDEPTSGLDPVIRDLVLTQIVKELAEEGKTMLVTNHHMEELLGVLHEIWILRDGRISQRFSLEDLRARCCRVTGRLKPGKKIDLNIEILDQQQIGNLVSWTVIEKDALLRIKEMEILEQFEVEPVGLETAFKLLLQDIKVS